MFICFIHISKKGIESKFIFNGRGIAFDGKGLWSIGNDSARNVVNFGGSNNREISF